MTAIALGIATAPPSEVKTGGGRSVKRVQLDLPPRSLERLHTMKEKTEAASYAEVVKNALRLYEALIDETDAGNELMLKTKDGQIIPYKVFV